MSFENFIHTLHNTHSTLFDAPMSRYSRSRRREIYPVYTSFPTPTTHACGYLSDEKGAFCMSDFSFKEPARNVIFLRKGLALQLLNK